MIFIDKSNKEKVRPISLSSCMGKIMERIVNNRLTWWMEWANVVDKTQMGFRKGKGCLENLLKITIDVSNNNKANKATLAAFLDVSGAYDNVNYNMINILDEFRCPGRIRNYIANWIQYRIVEFSRDNKEPVTRKVCKGLPQGAVVSPNLYSIYTARITKEVPEEVKVLQFADDIGLYVCTENIKNNKELIEKSIISIKKKFRRIRIRVGNNKN